MPQPAFHTTYRRYAIFYVAALVLLAGWLVFAKMPHGQQELAGSVENTFRESRAVIARSNHENWQVIQDMAADYPSQKSKEYATRATQVLSWASTFESHSEHTAQLLYSLKDSLVKAINYDTLYLMVTAVDTGFLNQGIKNYKTLKKNQLIVQAQALATGALNYFSMYNTGYDVCHWTKWYPSFLPSTFAPRASEPFEAVVFLSNNYNPRCATWSGWLDDQSLSFEDGIAHVRTICATPGSHTLRVHIRRELCRDGSITEFSRDFQVNVLERCDSIPSH